MTTTPFKAPAANKTPAKRKSATRVPLLANIDDILAAGNGKHRTPVIMNDGSVKYCAVQPNGQLDMNDCI